MYRTSSDDEAGPTAWQQHCEERGRKEAIGRAHVRGVVLCLGPVTQAEIVARCVRYYGMSPDEVEDRLFELVQLGGIDGVGLDAQGHQLWINVNLQREVA